MNRDLKAALHRMRAAIGVLDEELAAVDRMSGPPIPVELPHDAWQRAETARRLIEENLEQMERVARDAAQRAKGFEEEAEDALRRGDVSSAQRAGSAANAALEQAAALTVECNELKVFLTEWAVRVTQAPPTKRSDSID